MALGSGTWERPFVSTIASGSPPEVTISSNTSFAALPPIAPLSIMRMSRASFCGVVTSPTRSTSLRTQFAELLALPDSCAVASKKSAISRVVVSTSASAAGMPNPDS